jgi:hypothetical protein
MPHAHDPTCMTPSLAPHVQSECVPSVCPQCVALVWETSVRALLPRATHACHGGAGVTGAAAVQVHSWHAWGEDKVDPRRANVMPDDELRSARRLSHVAAHEAASHVMSAS